MTRRLKAARTLLTREEGAEVTELAVVLALVVAGAVAVIVQIGPKVAKLYADTNAAIP